MKRLTFVLPILAVLALAAVLIPTLAFPTVAQEGGAANYPMNTITVVGTGSAASEPTVANVNIGVRTNEPDVTMAFSNNSTTVDAVIEAIVGAGVARENIQTTNLNVYMIEDMPIGPDTPRNYRYEVNNDLRIRVDDAARVDEVIAAGMSAGANNIYGLTFGFGEENTLESTARAEAMADARARAQELANLAGARLGDIVVINDATSIGGSPTFDKFGFGGGGMPIEVGQLSTVAQVQVTFELIH